MSVNVFPTIARGRVRDNATSFTIPGHPVGYYAQGKLPNWSRMKKYVEYKKKVQLEALCHGLILPLKATKDRPVSIKVVSYFKTGVHCDPGNVLKGIVDALFYGGQGDKFTGGVFHWPLYDPVNPRAEVFVQELRN